MKKVYIAHPLRGGTRDIGSIYKNYLKADALMLTLGREHESEEILFLSPIHAFSFTSPLVGPQEWVLGQCRGLLELADEVWVFGDWQESEGCRMEVEHARELGITIVFEDGRVEGGYSTHWGETRCPGFDA